MLKFLVGLVVGVFLGVLVIAPNPELSDRVERLWDDARTWGAAFWEDAGEAAEQAAGQAGEAARDLREGAEEAAGEAARAVDEAGEEVQDNARDPGAASQ